MPSCTCLRSPAKYVSEPQKGPGSEPGPANIQEAQSIVTDSEAFDHQALLKQEGSTTYDGDTSHLETSPSASSLDSGAGEHEEPRPELDTSDYHPSARSSSSSGCGDESSREGETERASTNRSESRRSDAGDEGEARSFPKQKLRETVQKWNELLKMFDDEPDVIEIRKALTIVSMLSDNQDEETKQKVHETIRRLTASFAELRDESGDSEHELALQPFVGDDEETYFRCFLRKLRDHTGNSEVELEVNEVAAEHIRALVKSLSLSRRTLSLQSESVVVRAPSALGGPTVFKSLKDPVEASKQPMDLSAYLHQLSNQVENDDLASVSTLSEADLSYSGHAFSNCLVGTSRLLDSAICDPLKRCNRDIPALVSREMEKQAMLRNKYQDMSDLPLFIT